MWFWHPSKEEIKKAFKAHADVLPKVSLSEKAWKQLDADGNGVVSKTELAEALYYGEQDDGVEIIFDVTTTVAKVMNGAVGLAAFDLSPPLSYNTEDGMCRGKGGAYGGYCKCDPPPSSAGECFDLARDWPSLAAVEYRSSYQGPVQCALLQSSFAAPNDCPEGCRPLHGNMHTETVVTKYAGDGYPWNWCMLPTYEGGDGDAPHVALIAHITQQLRDALAPPTVLISEDFSEGAPGWHPRPPVDSTNAENYTAFLGRFGRLDFVEKTFAVEDAGAAIDLKAP